jgi:hypothetical protein
MLIESLFCSITSSLKHKDKFFDEQKGILEKHLPPQLDSRKGYMRWMYGVLKDISTKVRTEIPTYRGYAMRTMYYKSGCDKKTYRGKTCRRLNGGGRTKARDHRRTHRVSHSVLL